MSDPVADALRQAANAGASVSPATGEASDDPTVNFLRAAANTQGASIPSSQASLPTPAGPQGNDAGPGAAFVNGYNSLVPFGNKATDAIGVGIAKIGGVDGSFSDLYNQANADTKVTESANPRANAMGVGAGIATSIPIAKGAGALISGAFDGTKAAPVADYLSGLGKTPEGAGLVSKTANLGIRSAKGAAMAYPAGAVYGAGAAEPGHELEGAKSGGKMAAMVGAGIPVAGAGASAALDLVSPKVGEGLQQVGQLAQKYGIPVSLDQISTSKALKNVQKVSQELPFSGAGSFREKQMSAFNTALLKTVGVDANKFTPQVMDEAFTKVGKEFDDLGKGKTFNLGTDFKDKFDALMEEAKSTSTADARDNLQNAYNNALKNADAEGNISGETLGKVRAQLNGLSRKANNPDTSGLLHDLENNVVDTMTAGDDAASGAFSETKQKYKNLLALEPLAAKAKDGNISPALLSNRVGKIYGRQFTRGKAGELGDLAQIGSNLLPELGGSDTVQKAIYAMGGKAAAYGGSVGAAGVNLPATTAGLAANRIYQEAINRNQSLVGKILNPSQIAKLPPREAMTYLKNLSAGEIAGSSVKNSK